MHSPKTFTPIKNYFLNTYIVILGTLSSLTSPHTPTFFILSSSSYVTPLLPYSSLLCFIPFIKSYLLHVLFPLLPNLKIFSVEFQCIKHLTHTACYCYDGNIVFLSDSETLVRIYYLS